ncbi:MAG: acyltransferase [Bacteriovorax sp.]|nr:acyltransferase [Bacteriovorax sp.]
MNQHRGRDYSLDGIRGIAIVIVMIYHLVGVLAVSGADFHNPISKLIFVFIDDGWMGVDLFFTLSGYLITSILLKTKAEPNYLKNFFMRRSLRIFPLYYFFLIIYFIVLPYFFGEYSRFQHLESRQVWYWTYMSNFEIFFKQKWSDPAHLWSLGIEEQFYWFWPFIVLLFSSRTFHWLTAIIFILQPLIRLAFVLSGVTGNVIPAFTFSHLDGLMVGAFIATSLYRQTFTKESLRKWGYYLFFGGLLARLALPFIPVSFDIRRNVIAIDIWSLFSGGLILLSVTHAKESLINTLLTNRLLVFAGTYSYGLYMIHQLIFQYIAFKFGSIAGANLISLLQVGILGGIASFIGAWLLFKYFESPFLNLKEHFSYAKIKSH